MVAERIGLLVLLTLRSESTVEDALQQLADRLVRGEERFDVGENSEAERRSCPPVVTCSGDANECPTDCRPQRSGRLARAVVAVQRHEQNLWTVLCPS